MSKKPYFILFITLFIMMAGFGVIFPIMPFVSMQMGATPFELGALMAVYSLMQFIFSPFWGSLSDKYGRKPIILVGLLGFTLTFIMFGLSTKLWMLFASRVAGGILSSACLPTVMAYIADITTEEDRGSGMGMMGAAMGLGIIVGPAIGGLFSQISFGAPFFFSAALALVNLIFSIIFLKESKHQHDRNELKYNRFHHLLSLRGFMAFVFFLVFMISFSLSGLESTFSLFASDILNLNAFDVGIIFTFMGIVGVVVQGLLIGKLIRRFGEETVIKIGIAISFVGYFMLPFSKGLTSLLLLVCTIMIGNGLCRPSLASIISKDTVIEEGATMGAMQSIDSLGRIMGPLFGGLIYEVNFMLPYLSSGAINSVVFFVALFII